MSEFQNEAKQENVREVSIDLENIPDSLVYKLEEVEFTYNPVRFGMDWMDIDYYVRRVPIGLIEQFPCLSYLLEDYWREATQRTPLEEIEYRKSEKIEER
jgi:hypothetical protein